MPFTSILGSSDSSLGSTQLATQQPAYWGYGPNAVQDPWMQVQWFDTISGLWTPLVNAISATIVYGVDVVVATATIDFPDNQNLPNALISNNSLIQIICGAGPNNVLRFKGIYKRTRANLWPYTYSLICRGMLSLAEQYKQTLWATLPSFTVQNARVPVIGLSLFGLMNGLEPADYPTAVAGGAYNVIPTDENIVFAILSQVPNLIVDRADIGGTGHNFGDITWKEHTWRPYTSAIAQCQKYDEVCLGWRLFESLAGRPMRVQIHGYPNGIADYTFTEGIDVKTAIGGRSIEELINAEYLEGTGAFGAPGVINAFLQESNDFQPETEPHIDNFQSALIGDDDFARQVGQWRLTERNRETVDIEFVTHRDDLLIPGRTVAINLPHAAVTEPVWLQHVEIRIQAHPILWEQIGRGLGGGLVAGGTNPNPNIGGYGITPLIVY